MAGFMNHSHVGSRTARTKFAPLAQGLCESLHRFAPAGHLLVPTRYIVENAIIYSLVSSLACKHGTQNYVANYGVI